MSGMPVKCTEALFSAAMSSTNSLSSICTINGSLLLSLASAAASSSPATWSPPSGTASIGVWVGAHLASSAAVSAICQATKPRLAVRYQATTSAHSAVGTVPGLGTTRAAKLA